MNPAGIALEANGDLIVCDPHATPEGGALFRLTPTGRVTRLAQGDHLVQPMGVAITPSGDLYVTDRQAFDGNGGIVRIDPHTGNQVPVASGGEFVDPAGIGLLADGRLIISDMSEFAAGGKLILVDPATGSQERIFPGGILVKPLFLAVAPGIQPHRPSALNVKGPLVLRGDANLESVRISSGGALGTTGTLRVGSDAVVASAATLTCGAVFAGLLVLNRLGVQGLSFYLVLGIVMWYFMLQSGVHATLAGVLLAFALPFGDGSEKSPSYRLQHFLHKPVAFIIMPVFALANTGIALSGRWFENLTVPNSLGVFAGLFFGKPLGIFLAGFLAVKTRLSQLPGDVSWKHIIGAGLLGGICFTMSIFITLLAFSEPEIVK